jgi:hypothetical protein
MNQSDERPNNDAAGDRYPTQWYEPKPDVLAEPTYWPLILAAGITLTAWGAVTSVFLSLLGLVMTVASLVNWIGDIRREQEHEPESE